MGLDVSSSNERGAELQCGTKFCSVLYSRHNDTAHLTSYMEEKHSLRQHEIRAWSSRGRSDKGECHTHGWNADDFVEWVSVIVVETRCGDMDLRRHDAVRIHVRSDKIRSGYYKLMLGGEDIRGRLLATGGATGEEAYCGEVEKKGHVRAELIIIGCEYTLGDNRLNHRKQAGERDGGSQRDLILDYDAAGGGREYDHRQHGGTSCRICVTCGNITTAREVRDNEYDSALAERCLFTVHNIIRVRFELRLLYDTDVLGSVLHGNVRTQSMRQFIVTGAHTHTDYKGESRFNMLSLARSLDTVIREDGLIMYNVQMFLGRYAEAMSHVEICGGLRVSSALLVSTKRGVVGSGVLGKIGSWNVETTVVGVRAAQCTKIQKEIDSIGGEFRVVVLCFLGSLWCSVVVNGAGGGQILVGGCDEHKAEDDVTRIYVVETIFGTGFGYNRTTERTEEAIEGHNHSSMRVGSGIHGNWRSFRTRTGKFHCGERYTREGGDTRTVVEWGSMSRGIHYVSDLHGDRGELVEVQHSVGEERIGWEFDGGLDFMSTSQKARFIAVWPLGTPTESEPLWHQFLVANRAASVVEKRGRARKGRVRLGGKSGGKKGKLGKRLVERGGYGVRGEWEKGEGVGLGKRM
ncbi:hypothetical protein Tco_0385282 [Tanacetum coccineum]